MKCRAGQTGGTEQGKAAGNAWNRRPVLRMPSLFISYVIREAKIGRLGADPFHCISNILPLVSLRSSILYNTFAALFLFHAAGNSDEAPFAAYLLSQ